MYMYVVYEYLKATDMYEARYWGIVSACTIHRAHAVLSGHCNITSMYMCMTTPLSMIHVHVHVQCIYMYVILLSMYLKYRGHMYCTPTKKNSTQCRGCYDCALPKNTTLTWLRQTSRHTVLQVWV